MKKIKQNLRKLFARPAFKNVAPGNCVLRDEKNS
jgi:hypothetical protein